MKILKINNDNTLQIVSEHLNKRKILRETSTLTIHEASNTKIDVETRPMTAQQKQENKREAPRKARRLTKVYWIASDLNETHVDDPRHLYLHHIIICRSNDINILNVKACKKTNAQKTELIRLEEFSPQLDSNTKAIIRDAMFKAL